MAPHKKRVGENVSDLQQPANRLLLYLKLKVAAIRGPSLKLLRDATKAAEELDGCVALLENGPSALKLALAQVGMPISFWAGMLLGFHQACIASQDVRKQPR
jgi:hypothetical protein